MDIQVILGRALKFESEAHTILGKHEASRSRVITLEGTYAQLEHLNPKQKDLFKQSLKCVESELFRAAYVMGWAALMDYLEALLAADGFATLKRVRPKWTVGNLQELRESFPEAQIIDAMRDAGLITKSEAKQFHGYLNARNSCAHPSDYAPNLNTTLGYVSELLNALAKLQKGAGSP